MEVILSLGSNLGKKVDNLKDAVKELAKISEVIKESSIIETPPWGYTEQDSFLNQIIVVETELGPNELIEQILQIEELLGRKREFKWGPRLIDIDIIYYDDLIIESQELQVPHPHLYEREFVLAPLNEIYNTKLDPILKITVGEIYRNYLQERK